MLIEILNGEKMTDKADIFVSELLGSFGDDELLPEFFAGVQKLLKLGAISIPSESFAHFQPIMSRPALISLAKRDIIDSHCNWLLSPLNVYNPKQLGNSST
jgi:hypothetical protein